MLDVHPPHEPTHTWKDFLIHIATIVVGLLIAIALEQTVEYLHHRHELHQAHEALQRELETDQKLFAIDTDYLAHNVAALRNNLTVLIYLRQHPGTPRARLPGVLLWPNFYTDMAEITWRSVQGANLTELMPPAEVSDYSQIYNALEYMNQAAADSWLTITRAESYTFSDPDPTHLTPAQLDRQIELTDDALVSKYRLAVVMFNIGKSIPGFSHAPSADSLKEMTQATPLTPEQKADLAEAQRITNARLAKTPVPNL